MSMILAAINKRKADPKIASSIDIHCEIQAVPFTHLSQMKLGEPTAASSRWPAPSPTSKARRKYSPCTSPKLSATATWIEVSGQREGYKFTLELAFYHKESRAADAYKIYKAMAAQASASARAW